MVLQTKASINILIIDDDLDDADFLKSGFVNQPMSFRFIEQLNGQAALDYLIGLLNEKDPPAVLPRLIFLDLHMPGKSGFQVLEEIKDEAGLRHIPVIVMSSSMLQSDEEKCRAAGCERFIGKPASLEAYGEVASDTIQYLNKQDKLQLP